MEVLTLKSDMFVTPALLATLDEIRLWLRKLPANPNDKEREVGEWSTGSLVRAAKQRFGLKDWEIVDGEHSRYRSHSWLQKEIDAPHMQLILDLAPQNLYGGPVIVLEPTDQWYSPDYRPYYDHSEERLAQYDPDAGRILELPMSA